MKFDWYHFVLIVVVYFKLKKQTSFEEKKIDKGDKILHMLPKIDNIKYHIAFLILIPLFMVFSKLNSIFIERFISISSLVMGYRSLQSYIDSQNHVNIIFPLTVLMCIMLLHNKILEMKNIYSIYTYIFIIGIMCLLNGSTTTIQLTNDFMIVHSLYYIFKRY